MTQLTEHLKIICDFIRDASTPCMLINQKGECIFENPAMEKLNYKLFLKQYFHEDTGRFILNAASNQSTPLPFSFSRKQGRQRASIRRVLSHLTQIIFLVQILRNERMAAFTMASHAEQNAAQEGYEKKVISDRFEIFFNTGRDGKAILNRSGVILHNNPALLSLIGADSGKLKGKNFFDIFSNYPFQNVAGNKSTSYYDLSNIVPSQFDAEIVQAQRTTPVSISLESNKSEKNMEIFMSVRDLTSSRQFAEVQELNAELDAANKEMDEFNRLMSHEMRAPLSKLVSVAENLRSIDGLPENISQYTGIIEEAAKDALLQYSAILSLSRGKNRQIMPLVPSELKKRLMRQHSLSAEQHQIKLHGTIKGDSDEPVPIDATDTFLIMTNLISNALKHTEPMGNVEFGISIQKLNKNIELCVKDTGSGIDQTIQNRLFDDYVTTAGNMEIQSGIGVGLSIVKRAVENCGGKIDFDTEIGRGTEFRVLIPFSDVYIELGENALDLNRLNLASGDTVLIIDDDVVNLRILSARLKKAGFSVLLAESGIEAVHILTNMKDNWPKLIFVDRNMPNQNGMETTRIIRNFSTQNQPFICGLTAYVDNGIRQEMLASGMDWVEQKPLDQKTLEKYLCNKPNGTFEFQTSRK